MSKVVREELSHSIQSLAGCYLYKDEYVWVEVKDGDCDAACYGSIVCMGPHFWRALNRAEDEGAGVIGEMFELDLAGVKGLIGSIDLRGEFGAVVKELNLIQI